mmetsp:Transcript_84493/g.244259  ORF Transcript_84493/g.244259 Transcript_84493/m.244259 type:complete len:370 (-) Transcript_84493:535-1644(-)
MTARNNSCTFSESSVSGVGRGDVLPSGAAAANFDTSPSTAASSSTSVAGRGADGDLGDGGALLLAAASTTAAMVSAGAPRRTCETIRNLRARNGVATSVAGMQRSTSPSSASDNSRRALKSTSSHRCTVAGNASPSSPSAATPLRKAKKAICSRPSVGAPTSGDAQCTKASVPRGAAAGGLATIAAKVASSTTFDDAYFSEQFVRAKCRWSQRSRSPKYVEPNMSHSRLMENKCFTTVINDNAFWASWQAAALYDKSSSASAPWRCMLLCTSNATLGGNCAQSTMPGPAAAAPLASLPFAAASGTAAAAEDADVSKWRALRHSAARSMAAKRAKAVSVVVGGPAALRLRRQRTRSNSSNASRSKANTWE